MSYRNFEDAFALWTPEYIEYSDENVFLKSFNPKKDVEFNLAHVSFVNNNLDISIYIDGLPNIRTKGSTLTLLNKTITRYIEFTFEDEYAMNSFLDIYNNGL
jgi:hypothetical protein